MPTEPLVPTTYRIIQPDGATSEHTVMWPSEPDYATIHQLIESILKDWATHVHGFDAENRLVSIFVDEAGHMKNLLHNPLGSIPYIRRLKYYKQAPETLVGTVVQFDRLVWH